MPLFDFCRHRAGLVLLAANLGLKCFGMFKGNHFFKLLIAMNKLTKTLLQILALALLNGCGGEDNNIDRNQNVDALQPSSQTSYKAIDALRVGQLSNEFYLDLSTNMSSSDGSDVAIIDVSSMDSDDSCRPLYIDDKGFAIDATSANVCEYSYMVGAKSIARTRYLPHEHSEYAGDSEIVPATARATAAVGETVTMLDPMSSVTSEGEPVTVDVSNGGAIDTGAYTLSSKVSLPYSKYSGSSAVASPSTNEITYTPAPGFLGVERISYSYSDGVNIFNGDLDIAVSSSSNNAPVANNFQYQDSTTGSIIVSNGVQVAIDVSNYISDIDGEAVVINEVHSYDADVSISGPASLDFSSTEAGEHHITYVVSDNLGGFSSGVINIRVEPDPLQIRTWQDITYYDVHNSVDVTMTAPMSKVEAEHVGLPYSETYFGDGVYSPAYSEITLHSYDEAKEVCKAKGGRLPTQSEIEDSIQLFRDEGWPTDDHYWVGSSSDVGLSLSGPENAWIIEMKPDGVSLISQEGTSNRHLVTCMLYDSLAVRRYSVDQESYTVDGDKTKYRFRLLTPDGSPAQYSKNVLVTAGLSSKGAFTPTFYDADNLGWIDAYYSDLSFEDNIAVTQFYDTVNESIVSAFKSDSKLNVTDPTAWNRAVPEDEILNTGLPDLSSSLGLPVLVNRKQLTSVYNVKTYTGDSFVGRFSIVDTTDTRYGRYSFYIQQQGDTPDPFTWGDSNRPGGPDTKNFEVVVDIYTKSVKVFIDKARGESANFETGSIDLTGDRFIWFEVSNGQFFIYSSLADIKPEYPLLNFTMDWGMIDPNSSYWIGFGGRVSTGNPALTYVSEAYFRAITNSK